MPQYPDFVTSTGYGDVQGLSGVNCRHSFSAYFPNISPPPPSKEELAEMKRLATATTHYKWKDSRGVEHERDFTLRDALDRQNELARQLRDLRRRATGFKAAGLDEAYAETKSAYRVATAEYKLFSRTMGIDYNFQLKVYHDGLGRI